MKENWKRDDNPSANNNAHETRSTFMSPHRAAEAVTSILKPRGHRRSSSNTSPVAILLPTPSNNNSSPTLAGLSPLPQNASHGRNALVTSTPALEQLSPSPSATTHNPLAYSTPAYHQAPYTPSSSSSSSSASSSTTPTPTPSSSSWETGVSKPSSSTPSSVGYSSTGSTTTQRIGLQSRKFANGSKMAASFAVPSTSSNPNQLEKPRTRAEFEPKEFFDAIARALLSPSEPIYFFFCILLLLFLFVCCHFFGILLVWGTTLLFLYIISMHQSQESRDIFYKNWLQFHPKENPLRQKRVQALEELDWLNNMLHQVWVGVAPELCNKHILPKAHLIIDKALPNALKKLDAQIVIKEINMGSTAPLVTLLEYEKMDPIRPNRMTLTCCAKWASADDAYILLDIGYMMLHFPVRVDSFVANMMLQIVILADGKDLDQSVISVSVLNDDSVEMPAIKPLGVVPDVLMLPLRKWINKIVHQNINDLLGPPQCLSFSLRELKLDTIEEDPIVDIQVYTDSEKTVPSDYHLLGKTVTGYAANLNSGKVGCGGVYLIYKRGKTERPITDIAIIFRDGEKQRLGEAAPPDFECITKTLVSGTSADLNSGVGREIYLCVKRGEAPPITKLGIVFADREEVAPPGYYMVTHTASGQWKANVNSGDKSGRHIYVCYQGGNPPNSFLSAEMAKAPITDLAIILPDQDEKIPDGFTCIETSWSGSFAADLHARHTLTKFNPLNFYKSKAETYLCYKRCTSGKEKPITEIAVIFADADKRDVDKRLPPGELSLASEGGWTVVEKTASGRWPGNLNARDAPPTARTVYLAFRKGDGPPITDLAIYFKGKEPEPSSYTVIRNTLSKAWRADLNSGSGGREVYLCYLAANRGDALKPSPAPEIGVTPTTPNMPREEPSEELSRLSRLANNLPTLPAFLRSSETNNPKAETLQIASLAPEDDRSRFGINRFVSGVVNTKQRVTGRIRKAVGERQKEVTEKDSQTIGQYLLNGELQKVKEKMRELETETLATIPLPSGHSGNWLHIAVSARQNAEAIMNFALSFNSLDVNQQSDSGYTPLHLAAHEGNLSVCGILLLNESASPSIVNKDGLIPLHLFVLHSYTWFGMRFEDVVNFYDIFITLAKEGKLVNKISGDGETPLHFSVKKDGGKDNVFILLALGANPNITDKKGNSPLHAALLGKKKEVVTKLLEAGADLSATGSLGSCADLLRSSIDFSQIAAKFPKVEEVHSKEEASKQIFDALCKGDAHQLRALCYHFSSYSDIPPPPTFSIDGQSWLHLASYEGNVSVVRVLSPLRDSPLNLKSKLGRTPLHEAALMGHWEIITELVKAGANPSIKALTPDANLALHYACQRKLPRNPDLISMFLLIRALHLLADHKSLVNQANDRGETAIHMCTKNGSRPNLLVLAKLGANLNEMDKQGRTPLLTAIRKGKVGLTSDLIALGAIVDQHCWEFARKSVLPTAPPILALLRTTPNTVS